LFKNKKFRAKRRFDEPQHEEEVHLTEEQERRSLQANNEHANELNALDDKKADPSADKGVDKVEQRDNPNKHVDKQNKKESKKVTPPLRLPLVIFSHTNQQVKHFIRLK
jgi:hypothetical protein